jgi:hypothetical protein
MNNTNKKELGQFYTKNYEYILQNMKIPKASKTFKTIIEPFAGDGDLLDFIDKSKYTLECYDIEPKHDYIIKKDTLNNPPDYTNKFILTNPPYLARNKSKDKTIYDKYKCNDLYKCFITHIITNPALGGIMIIPLNFWSSIRNIDVKLRKDFLKIYSITQINIFEETVFEDTTYTICSVLFNKIKDNKNNNDINITIYPFKTNNTIQLNKDNNYTIGGEIYKLKSDNKYTVSRLTSKNLDKQNTNLVIQCIDMNIDNKIKLSYKKDVYIDTTPKQTARTYATLIITPEISEDKQKLLTVKFNDFLEDKRCKYNSLFLTNYRESKVIARKRISFDLVYLIVKHLL